MEREIKFRAWDTERKAMASSVGISKDSSKYKWGADTEVGGLFINPTCDRFKLMQFTGLLDKNGKEIYESDKCKGKRPNFSEVFEGAVIYDDEMAAFCLKLEGNYMPIALSEFDELEKIGNIYENENLIK